MNTIRELEQQEKYKNMLKRKNKEIKRLKEEKESWKRVATKNFNEAEDYKSIIKEVRKYIENNWISKKDADNYRLDDEELDIEISDIAVLYDILNKGE